MAATTDMEELSVYFGDGNHKGRSKKSIESELEFYQVKGGKTKSVYNRIARLEEALEKYGQGGIGWQ